MLRGREAKSRIIAVGRAIHPTGHNIYGFYIYPLSVLTMSQNHRNSNPIYLLGAIVGIITVLTYMGIKPYSTPSVNTGDQTFS